MDPLIDPAKPKTRWVFSVFTARPFGMVRLAPNTDPVGTWGAGYCHGSDRIVHFSHLRAWQLAGVPVMPTPGPPGDQVGSRFSHDHEEAGAGYYRVGLLDTGVEAELTATDRVGLHRYTFPTGATPHLVLDLGAELGPCAMAEARAWQVDGQAIAGFVENEVTRRRHRRVRLWFYARVDRPIRSLHGSGGPDGPCRRLVVACQDGGGPLVLKVALSFVDLEGARRNLATELPDWDFDGTVAASRRARAAWLGRVEVEGGPAAARTKLYTDLWRALVGGHVVSDVDGRWLDQTTAAAGVVRTTTGSAGGRAALPMVCGQDGFWHAQWSLRLLYSLAFPDLMDAYSRFLVELGSHGGLIPRGPSAGGHTYVMIGASSTPWLVSCWLKGIGSFDVAGAYEGMCRNALPGGLMSKAGYEFDTCQGGGVEDYLARGWIPEGRRVPGAMHLDGAWRVPFDPLALDRGFRQAASMDFYAPRPDLPRQRATVNYGNEPGRFAAHLFNHLGAPWLAQKWARAVQRQTFASVSPQGYREDDDQGKAAATSALLALGLFDLLGGCAGEPAYEITAPVFERVTLHLHPDHCEGETFVIEAPGAPDQVYIQTARLDGDPLPSCRLAHRRVAAGGRLELELGPAPNRRWGAPCP